jgi:pentatricopeptide repeat protein
MEPGRLFERAPQNELNELPEAVQIEIEESDPQVVLSLLRDYNNEHQKKLLPSTEEIKQPAEEKLSDQKSLAISVSNRGALLSYKTEEDVAYQGNNCLKYLLTQRAVNKEEIKSIFDLMKQSSLPVDNESYEMMISYFMDSKQHSEAENLVTLAMNEPNLIPSSFLWETKLRLLVIQNKYDDMRKLMKYLTKMKVSLSTEAYNAVLKELVYSINGKYSMQQIIDYWIFMHEVDGLKFNIESFRLMLTQCFFKGEAEKAFFYYDEMKSFGIVPNERIFIPLIRAAARAPFWINGYQDTIVDALIAMENHEFVPDTTTYNEIIYAWGCTGDSVASEYYFWEMRRKDIPITQQTYANLFYGYSKANSANAKSYGLKKRFWKQPEKANSPAEEDERLVDLKDKFALDAAGTAVKVTELKGRRRPMIDIIDLYEEERGATYLQAMHAKANKIRNYQIINEFLILSEGRNLEQYKTDMKNEQLAKRRAKKQQLLGVKNKGRKALDIEDDDGEEVDLFDAMMKEKRKVLAEKRKILSKTKQGAKDISPKEKEGEKEDPYAFIDNFDEFDVETRNAVKEKMRLEMDPKARIEKYGADLKPIDHDKYMEVIPFLLHDINYEEYLDYAENESETKLRSKRLENLRFFLKRIKNEVEEMKDNLHIESVEKVRRKLQMLDVEEKKRLTYKVVLKKLKNSSFPEDGAFEDCFLHCPAIKGEIVMKNRMNLLEEFGMNEEELALEGSKRKPQENESWFRFEQNGNEEEPLTEEKLAKVQKARAQEQLKAISLLDQEGAEDALTGKTDMEKFDKAGRIISKNRSLVGNQSAKELKGEKEDSDATLSKSLIRTIDEKWDLIEYGRPPVQNFDYTLGVTRQINKYRAELAWKEMIAQGIEPNQTTWNRYLMVFADAVDAERTKKVRDEMVANNISVTPEAYESLMKLFLRSNDLEGTEAILVEMKQKRVVHPPCYGLMIQGFASKQKLVEALKLVEECADNGIRIPEKNLKYLRFKCWDMGVNHPSMPPDPKQWVYDLKATQKKKKFAGKRKIQSIGSLSFI